MILGAESFLALAERLQNALWAAGGGPREHRGDSLSAAFRKLAKDAREDLTGRHDPLYAGSARQPTRNNRGIAHENRAVESPHGHLKNAVPDATLLRGTSDFDDLAAHRPFFGKIVSRHNAHHAKRIEAERPHRRTCRDSDRVPDPPPSCLGPWRCGRGMAQATMENHSNVLPAGTPTVEKPGTAPVSLAGFPR